MKGFAMIANRVIPSAFAVALVLLLGGLPASGALQAGNGMEDSAKELRAAGDPPAADQSRGLDAQRDRRDGVGAQAIVPEPVRPWRSELDLRVWTDQNTYLPGDEVRVFVRASRDCYLYVFNVDTEGVERQIFPNRYSRNARIRGDRPFSIPDGEYRLRVSERGRPGLEKLRAVAVSRPYEVIREYDRFDSGDPFPVRPGGAEALTHRLRREEERERAASEGPGVTGGLSLHGAAGSLSIRVEPIRPPAPPVVRYYAEAHSSFEVRAVRPYRQGRLRVNSSPGGALVYVDGEYRGRTPLRLERVAYGPHAILITRPGYADYHQRVYIDSGEAAYIDARLRRLGR
jgi:hypothetical protein